jgi:DNA-binding LytR/AlgR family response regulator
VCSSDLKIIIVCKNTQIEFRGNFKDLIKILDMNYFTQCHQGFIINNDKISIYKDQNVFIEELNKQIPVGKSYINQVKNIFSKNLFG